MPNWCYNRVEVYIEDEEEVKRWKETVESKESKFDFNKIVPMPEELEGTVKGTNHVPSEELKEKYGADNWYDWSINNWGVKWNVTVDEGEVDDDDDFITYTFDTAWGPPHEIFYALRKKFPDMSISWFFDEPGMQFAGYLNE